MNQSYFNHIVRVGFFIKKINEGDTLEVTRTVTLESKFKIHSPTQYCHSPHNP
jgi:hypothetical protein